VLLVPGETSLAFYTATNPTDKPVIGISTYNVIPYDAGQYFNKIQCFCFEEQMLNPCVTSPSLSLRMRVRGLLDARVLLDALVLGPPYTSRAAAYTQRIFGIDNITSYYDSQSESLLRYSIH
jgi:hypothetical protein